MQVSIDAFEWYAVSGWLVKAAQSQFHGSISWFNSRSLLRGTLCGSILKAQAWPPIFQVSFRHSKFGFTPISNEANTQD
jgi:hypothetical protein